MRALGYYIHEATNSHGKGANPGVQKKIEQQISAFSTNYDVSQVPLVPTNSKILKALPLGNLYQWNNINIPIEDVAFLYIRKPLLDVGFFKFLRNIKKKNKEIIVLLELPTFPYDDEQFSKFSHLPLKWKDQFYRKKIKKYVSKIVTYTEDKKIFEISTICIQNGVDVGQISPVIPREEDNEIHLLAVAALQPYHGYERIIEGLYDYYRKGGEKIVRFFVVGNGEVENELELLVQKYNLEDKVLFFGMRTGDELTSVFNQSDIGIGSFGFFKIGLDRASSLKTREYLARGLPVISGCRQDIFEIVPCNYHMEFPNDCSPVDIGKIVDFYDRLFVGKNKLNVFREIRTYAEKNVTMERAFAPVIDYLKENI